MKKKLLAITMSFLMIGAIAGCGNTNNTASTSNVQDGQVPLSSTVSGKEEVIVAINLEPSSGFNPVTGYGQRFDPIIQSTLTKAYGGELTYDLATAFEASEDGLDWTFTIRDNAFFSNGEKVTAKDVAFTYEMVRDQGTGLDLSNIESVEVIDDVTLVFHLNEPDFTFAYVTYKVGIVPEAYYDDNYGENPIGSGAYKLVSWDKGQQCVWEYNEYYYGEEPAIKRVVILFMDDDAAFMAAQRGDVDVVFTNQNLATQTIAGYTMENIETIDNYGIIFPTTLAEGEVTADGNPIGNDVTGDVAIRRALSLGLDREALVNDVFNGYAKVSYSLCDTMPWFNEETALNETNSGLEVAKKILDEAGWIDTDNDGIREKDGVEASFALYYTSNNMNRQSIAMAVSIQAKELGISIDPKGASNDEIGALKFSMPYMFGRGDYTPNEFYLMTSTNTRGAGWSNSGYYSNPVVDEYMRLAMASNNMEDVYQYYKLAQWDGETGASLIGDAPDCWLVRADHCYFVRDGLNIGDQPIQSHCANGQIILSNLTSWRFE